MTITFPRQPRKERSLTAALHIGKSGRELRAEFPPRPVRVSPLRQILPCAGISRTLSLMEVHFSPDVETQLQQLAVANGKNAEQLVKDTVARMLENQARFIAGVQRGIEQADRGEFVEHRDVLNGIDRLFHL